MVKNLPVNARDARNTSLITGSGRSPRVGNGNPHILAWKISWTENLPDYSPRGPKELDTTEHAHNATCFGKQQNLDTIMLYAQGSASNQKLVNLLTIRKK